MSGDEVYLPPEAVTSRLEVRDPVTQGRRAWGHLSEDGLLIMSDAGDVWVRHGPEEVLGSMSAARDFAHEQTLADKGGWFYRNCISTHSFLIGDALPFAKWR